MGENRRNAKLRENIGQYIDACAELGVPQRELYTTADLFENKNWKAVLKNINGLARHCHLDVPGFPGPHMGIRKKGRSGRSWGMPSAGGIPNSIKSVKESVSPSLPHRGEDVLSATGLRTESL
eukprot:CAMPEP_0183346580 /NCGR_PEP_ID=MMETSP0164_2-20130417/11659_1 /TAXON_ID=221442 /ORGANISM="Coccolithus pelagicus ssp braarudi, Strain PLY182g" /LENGTH=122 /DNA_ID=CAMNT_0025517875 /DNA_START=250 /DNA_END=618 /DNA_ORIENTATION=+